MSKEPSPVEWPNAGRPNGDPDGLLRAFFRAELPDPWPALRRPDGPACFVGANGTAPGRDHPSETARARSWALPRPALRRRLALAAAAVLLLLGTLLLSGQFRNGTPETPVGPAMATPNLPKDVIIEESLIQDGEQPTRYQINIYAP